MKKRTINYYQYRLSIENERQSFIILESLASKTFTNKSSCMRREHCLVINSKLDS